jgi:cobalamin biosynthetic protein CobC
LDAAIAQFGGTRAGWIDLSTGINPAPYPMPKIAPDAWTALPDSGALDRLLTAARSFWNVPDTAQIIAANGASALIARMPDLAAGRTVHIPAPTYNEHAAAFAAHGYILLETAPDAQVLVHPNNPDGHLWTATDCTAPFTVIDESFCDITPDASLIHLTEKPGTVVLKSFGKFWGLAGARLGFAIAHPATFAGPPTLADQLGPWAVAGPTLDIGTAALSDQTWAEQTRMRLTSDTTRLDALMIERGATLAGGTPLFRLYDVGDAVQLQTRLATAHIWSRVFPYSDRWLRLGLPASNGWDRLQDALA